MRQGRDPHLLPGGVRIAVEQRLVSARDLPIISFGAMNDTPAYAGAGSAMLQGRRPGLESGLIGKTAESVFVNATQPTARVPAVQLVELIGGKESGRELLLGQSGLHLAKPACQPLRIGV